MRMRLRNNDAELFGLLETSAQHLVNACELLVKIVAADRHGRAELREKLHAEEHQADYVHHEFKRLIVDTFVTPIARDDLMRMGARLDDCVDLVDEAGDVIVLYQANSLPASCTRQVEILRRCAELTLAALGSLRSGDDLNEYCVEINSLENEGDQVFRSTIAALFAQEKDPIRLIKHQQIIERFEAAIDAFEVFADLVETTVAQG